MLTRFSMLMLAVLAVFNVPMWADESLKSVLGLSMDQARQADAIQASHRPKFAAKRQERNRELRVLRRARIANDSQLVAKQEQVTAKLHEELRLIRVSEDEQIRRLLTPEQNRKFAEYVKLRKEMVGSSRDDKDF